MPSHSTRFHSTYPANSGSRVLRSAAVQYFVACSYAPVPKGSISATACANSGRERKAAAIPYRTRKAMTPTYVHIIERVAVAIAKNPAPVTNSVGTQTSR